MDTKNVKCNLCQEQAATLIILTTDLDGILIERVCLCTDCCYIVPGGNQ